MNEYAPPAPPIDIDPRSFPPSPPHSPPTITSHPLLVTSCPPPPLPPARRTPLFRPLKNAEMKSYTCPVESYMEDNPSPVYGDGDDDAMSKHDLTCDENEHGDEEESGDDGYQGDVYPVNGGMGGGCGAGSCTCSSALACCLKGWTGWKVGKMEVAVCLVVAIYVCLAIVFWELFRGHFEWLESLSITVKVGRAVGLD